MEEAWELVLKNKTKINVDATSPLIFCVGRQPVAVVEEEDEEECWGALGQRDNALTHCGKAAYFFSQIRTHARTHTHLCEVGVSREAPLHTHTQ